MLDLIVSNLPGLGADSVDADTSLCNINADLAINEGLVEFSES